MPLTTSTRDDRLAELIANLAEQQHRGVADVDAAAREHPDLADELRSLWATAQFAAAFASPRAAALTLPSPPSEPTPPPDSFGDYEILEELGRGGMGVVYRARQRSLGRIVAIKMMREARLSSDSDRSRFSAEAEAAARLTHPNIVTVYEVGAKHAAVHRHGIRRGPQSRSAPGGGPIPREAAKLVAEVARAVHHAHERGVLHRDLKPATYLKQTEERTEDR